jgi:hypothetical protein
MEYIAKNQKRLAMFALGCMGARFGLAYLARLTNKIKNLSIPLSGILATMGMGFILIYTNNWRKSGLETDGMKIWWNDLRPIHGLLYIVSALSIMKGENIYASNLLISDTLLGLASWLLFHYNNMKK